jgi:PmbA protein
VTDVVALAGSVVHRSQPGESVEAYVARELETEVRVFEGEVESLTSAESAGVGIRVVAGDRQGFAYAGSLDESMLAGALEDARDNARFATPDVHVGLPRPDAAPAARLDLWRDGLAGVATDEKVALALELERRVRAGDSRIRQVESASYGDASIEFAVASTEGISVSSRQTACFVSAYAIAGDESGTQTGAGYSVGREPDELEVDDAANDAVERATRLLGARKAPSDRLTVVLDPRVTSTLLGILSGTLSGDAVAKGRSLFADRLGEQVAVPFLTLVDDPTDPLAYGATPYDAEGLATRRNVPIESGTLGCFLYDTESASRAATASTASAVRAGYKSTPGVGCRALSLVPGERDQSQILAEIGEGLLVQSVTGVHSGVNPISGDFSVGAEGLMIRGGSLAEPVREITIASTIQKMLRNVVAVGSDLERLPGIAAGVTLAIADVSMSGS